MSLNLVETIFHVEKKKSELIISEIHFLLSEFNFSLEFEYCNYWLNTLDEGEQDVVSIEVNTKEDSINAYNKIKGNKLGGGLNYITPNNDTNLIGNPILVCFESFDNQYISLITFFIKQNLYEQFAHLYKKVFIEILKIQTVLYTGQGVESQKGWDKDHVIDELKKGNMLAQFAFNFDN